MCLVEGDALFVYVFFWGGGAGECHRAGGGGAQAGPQEAGACSSGSAGRLCFCRAWRRMAVVVKGRTGMWRNAVWEGFCLACVSCVMCLDA